MIAGLKGVVRQVLHRFGYQLSRTSSTPTDPFDVQRELVDLKEPVILDVGAHVGSVAQIYRARWPLASIYCFEPFPESFQMLSKNVEGGSRTSCFKTAVSDKKGTAVLNANLSAATNSLLATDERGSLFWGDGLLDTKSQLEVDTTTVDDFCREKRFSHIDILKMDVQGAEFSVLQGARDMLGREGISVIYTELIMCPTYKEQHKLHEYLTFLATFGYDLLDLFNPVRRANQLLQADALFLSSSFKQEIDNRSKPLPARN